MLFYGMYVFFKPNQEILQVNTSQSFDSYLEEALARNTIPEERYRVVFLWGDFFDITTTPSSEKYITGHNASIDNSYNKKWYSMPFESDLNTVQKVNFQVSTGTEIISSSKGNFGTPGATSTVVNSAGWSSECEWLIFNPCIVVSNYLPSNREMYLWTTRIYRNPNEM